MSPGRSILTAFATGAFASIASAGCGGKAKSDGDYEPPPAVVANAPPVDPPVPKIGDPDPKTPGATTPLPPVNPMPPGSGSPVPSVPMPPLPGAKDPAPKDNTPPPVFMPPPMPDRPMAEKKDPEKAFEWPTAIYSRPLSEYIKDINDGDPAIREQALRTIPNFGPPARKAATKAVIYRMNGVNEADPGVRAAAFEAIGAFALLSPDGTLETDADTTEAIRILVLTVQASSGGTRLHAVNTLASFGPRAASAIPTLIGLNMTKEERAYETRRAVATTLGAIAFIKDSGPSSRALHSLSEVLVHDPSAAVRLAAYQSIFALGPPYEPAPPPTPGQPKPVLKVDAKAVEGYVKSIKSRLQPYKAPIGGPKERESPTGLIERDRQVEIFARLALMRLDPKEVNDGNLNGICRYIAQPGDSGPKLQALSALGFIGEASARRINDVVQALNDEDPQVVVAAVYALVAMGKEAKPAIEFLEKLKLRGSTKGDKEAKDFPKEYYQDLAKRAIKAINEAKPAVVMP